MPRIKKKSARMLSAQKKQERTAAEAEGQCGELAPVCNADAHGCEEKTVCPPSAFTMGNGGAASQLTGLGVCPSTFPEGKASLSVVVGTCLPHDTVTTGCFSPALMMPCQGQRKSFDWATTSKSRANDKRLQTRKVVQRCRRDEGYRRSERNKNLARLQEHRKDSQRYGREKQVNRRKITSKRTDAAYSQVEREGNRDRMGTVRQKAQYRRQERRQNMKRMRTVRQCIDFQQRESSENRARMSTLRQDSDYKQREQDENRERMHTLRQDYDYQHRERDENRERIHTLRQGDDFQQRERKENRERIHTLRQGDDFQQRERDENRERMHTLRQDDDYQHKERDENRERMHTLRQDDDYQHRERDENRERMHTLRQDDDYQHRERDDNRQRIHTLRQDKDFRQRERELRTQKRRTTRQGDDRPYMRQNSKDNRQRKRTVKERTRQKTSRHQRKAQDGEGTPRAAVPTGIEQMGVSGQEAMEVGGPVGNVQKTVGNDLYQREIQEGPTYVCTSCGCLFFRGSVQPFLEQNFRQSGVSQEFLDTHCKCIQHCDWICRTCALHVKNSRVPRLCLTNGLQFPELPDVLKGLTALEERLISPRIPFMQIRSLGVDRQQGLKGNVVNVPVDIGRTVDVLPRSFSETQTVQLKLMRRMRYKGPYIFETIRPHRVFEAAKFLISTPLYQKHGITLSEEWLTQHMAEVENFVVESCDEGQQVHTEADQSAEKVADGDQTDKPDSDHQTDKAGEDQDEDDWDETRDDEPLNPGVDDTLLENSDDTAIKFAPGEGQRPLPVLMDEDCEELSFPTIFVGTKRTVPKKVSYADVAKSEARRFDRRATNVPKLFFSYKKMEMTRVVSSIQTCLHKAGNTKGYTARDILDKDAVTAIVKANEGYRILKTVRGSPPFWEQKKKELLAMVRQLGCPTFFFTLSAAETKWPELLVILHRLLRGSEISEEAAAGLSFQEKTALLREDPVTCARYFDHRFRSLFHRVLKSGDQPLGEITDFFYRVEFQHRGSPHVHGLLWIKDAPEYDSENQETVPTVIQFVDHFITCARPEEGQPMHEEVCLQQHRHSHTCLKQKGKEKTCRFGIPHFPMPDTMILEPLADSELSENPINAKMMREQLHKEAKIIKDRLSALKPGETITLEDILTELNMTLEDYIRAIRTTIKRTKVFLKRGKNELRTNAYNTDILRLWRANMDIQYIVDPYACVMYIINYVGKSQRGMSALLRDALTEVRKGNLSIREQLRKIGNVFINSTEISAQEVSYYLLGMPVANASRTTVFVNTGEPDKRVRMLKPDDVLRNMDPDSKEIVCDGILDHYTARPACLEDLCLADFATLYNYQGQDKGAAEPHDDVPDGHRQETTNTGEKFQLKTGGIIIRRKKAKILRFRNYDELKDPDNFYREQLMLYHPWRNEDLELINMNHKARFQQLKESIMEKRNQYCSRRENELVRAAEQLQEAGEGDNDRIDDVVPIADMDEAEFPDQLEEVVAMEGENDEQVDILEQIGQPARQEPAERFLAPAHIPDTDFEELVTSLNSVQRKYMLHVVHSFKTESLPLYEFVSGGAGVGKSRLIKVLHQALIRYFSSIPGAHPDDVYVLLCAPTGKAAFNIGGMTLHSALSLPVSQYAGPLPTLGPEVSNTLATKLHSLKLIIIDEVSMCGAKMLNTISIRLSQIFKSDLPFGGISIISVGDFNQLPPVADSFPFQCPRSREGYDELAGPTLWEHFHLVELKEIMRQRDDLHFAQALSRMAHGEMEEEDIALFKGRVFQEGDPHIPTDALHLFQTNAKVSAYNNATLNALNTEGMESVANDVCQGDAATKVKEDFLTYVSGLRTSDTHGLPYHLQLKLTAKYMVTNNINTADGLVNGATGQLMKIDYGQRSDGHVIPMRVWILFDDQKVGAEARQQRAQLARVKQLPDTWTPIEPICQVVRRKQTGGNLQILRRQFPLVPAMAITIHKSQGDTYSQVVVHLSPGISRAALYVACSRAKSADGLFMIGEFKSPRKPHPKDKVTVEMTRLRQHRPVTPCLLFLDDVDPTEKLRFVFHNVQSLQKHHQSLQADSSLMAADALFLVETWALASDQFTLPGFHTAYTLSCEGTVRKPCGIAVFAKPVLEARMEHENRLTGSGWHAELAVIHLGESVEGVTVIVLYKSPKAPVSAVIELLTTCAEILSPCQIERLVLVGDFNINRSSTQGENLISFLARGGMGQGVFLRSMLPADEPTTNQGTQIDMCFSSFPLDVVSADTYESVTSYHKPIWILVDKQKL